MPPTVLENAPLILLAIVQTVRLLVARHNARRMRDPGEDRRIPAEFDEEEYWELKAQVKSIQQRMDHANGKLSELTSKFIRLPTELKHDFLDLELGQEWAQQCKGDRVTLHAEVKELRADMRSLAVDVAEIQRAPPWPKRVDRNRP